MSTGTRVRKRIGMGQQADGPPVPVVGMGVNLPQPEVAAEAPAEAAVTPPEPTGPVPEFKAGQRAQYWDDQLVGLVPLLADVLRPTPNQPGRYAVNVHLNGMLRYCPDAPAAAGPKKFSLTPLE
jgi:hypothetical protein